MRNRHILFRVKSEIGAVVSLQTIYAGDLRIAFELECTGYASVVSVILPANPEKATTFCA